MHQGLPLIRWEIDQGSVVVLHRRAFLSAEIPGHPDMDRDLNYSGSIPTATTSDPRSWTASRRFMSNQDQGSVQVARYFEARLNLLHNLKLSQLN